MLPCIAPAKTNDNNGRGGTIRGDLMDATIRAIDQLNLRVGRVVMWLAVIMAIVQFIVVIMRYVFAIGFIPLQESIWYMHGLLFTLGAGFALMIDGHVRVDVFYREAGPQRKALVDLLGSIFLLLPTCVATLWLSGSYVTNSWRVLEGSTETSGLPLIFLLKTAIWIFAILLGLQGVALLLRAWRALIRNSETYSASATGGHDSVA